MCTKYNDSERCYRNDSFLLWCSECIDDWFAIVAEEEACGEDELCEEEELDEEEVYKNQRHEDK